MGNSIVAGLSAKSGPAAENGKLTAKEQAELDQKMAAMNKSVQNRMSGKTEDGATYTSDGVRTYGTTAKVDSSGNVTDLSGNFHINAKELRDVVNNEQWDVLGSVMSLRGDDELAFGGDAILGRDKAGFLRNELNIYADEAHGRIELANKLGLVSLTGITSSLTGALRAVSRGVSDNVMPATREVLRDSALRTRTAVLENYHNVAPKHASDNPWANFKPNGLPHADIDNFLGTKQGQDLFELYTKGRPNSTADRIYDDFRKMLGSATDLPQPANLQPRQSLLKVTSSDSVGPTSEFFTTAGEIRKARKAGVTLVDYFALPGVNESPVYNLFKMQPSTVQGGSVFKSQIAPATDYLIHRSGNGQQYIVPNRNEWGVPVLLRRIGN